MFITPYGKNFRMNGDYVKKDIFFDSALVFCAPRIQNLPKAKTKTDVSGGGVSISSDK